MCFTVKINCVLLITELPFQINAWVFGVEVQASEWVDAKSSVKQRRWWNKSDDTRSLRLEVFFVRWCRNCCPVLIKFSSRCLCLLLPYSSCPILTSEVKLFCPTINVFASYSQRYLRTSNIFNSYMKNRLIIIINKKLFYFILHIQNKKSAVWGTASIPAPGTRILWYVLEVNWTVLDRLK